MKENNQIVVAGLGEVGKPLYEIISRYHDTIGVDVAPPPREIGEVKVLHVCYPFQIRDFIGETARYIDKYQPQLTIINSTVSVGTTRAIADRTGAAVVNSPVRGKHARMVEELGKYVKFVGAMDAASGKKAAEHFESVGMKAKVLPSPEASELAKLTETTFFGVMIAWAQEVERYCDQFDVRYDDVVSFYDEIKFFPPVKYFPGVIGGHCVMPNIEILRKLNESDMLMAIQESNRMKIERDAARELAAVAAEKVAV